MSVSISKAIAQALVDNAGQGLVAGTSCFSNYMPPNPDQLVVVYGYVDEPPLETFGTATPVATVARIQMVARAAKLDFDTAEALCQACWDYLVGIADQTLESMNMLRIQPTDLPTTQGVDEDQRPKVAANFRVTFTGE